MWSVGNKTFADIAWLQSCFPPPILYITDKSLLDRGYYYEIIHRSKEASGYLYFSISVMKSFYMCFLRDDLLCPDSFQRCNFRHTFVAFHHSRYWWVTYSQIVEYVFSSLTCCGQQHMSSFIAFYRNINSHSGSKFYIPLLKRQVLVKMRPR